MTSRGRVKLVATLPASFASGALRMGGYPWLSSPPAADGDKRGLDVTSRNIVNSEPTTGDKRSALDAPGTFDDDGCAEQGDGTAAAGSKPEQGEMSNKAGASSTVLEGRFGNERVGEKRRFGDTCGNRWWGEAAEEGPCGEGAGARGEKLKDKTARDSERVSAEWKSRKDRVSFKSSSSSGGRGATSEGGEGGPGEKARGQRSLERTH